MPQTNETPKRFLPDECERVDVAGVDCLSIRVGKLHRSIDFYTHLFGFDIVEDARGRSNPYVIMRGSGSVYLAIHERRREPVQAHLTVSRWSFMVDDLDHVRETVWNLGVPTANGCDELRRIHHWRENRSFLICDPDGHEIELVERLGGRPDWIDDKRSDSTTKDRDLRIVSDGQGR